MRSVILKVWQWVGDLALGAAGRASRLDDHRSESPKAEGQPVPGCKIRQAFEVIQGGKEAGLPSTDGRQRPVGPQKPFQRAS